MSTSVDRGPHGGPAEVKAQSTQIEHVYDIDEKNLDARADFADYKAGAIEAENVEHNMTVLEAVRAYPMASFWAFVMSFTIVSRPRPRLSG